MKKLLVLFMVLFLIVGLQSCKGEEDKFVNVYGVDLENHSLVFVSDYTYDGDLNFYGDYVLIDGEKYLIYSYAVQSSSRSAQYRPQYVIKVKGDI